MVMSPHDIPNTWVKSVAVPEIAISAATDYVATWVAPFKCKVTAIKYVSSDAVTGANTNSVSLNVDGPNTTTECAYLDLIAGTNLAAGVATALTLTTTAGFNANAGESLRLEAEEVGVGLAAAIGYGALVIEFESR